MYLHGVNVVVTEREDWRVRIGFHFEDCVYAALSTRIIGPLTNVVCAYDALQLCCYW
jgi:hypothetical protein